MAKKHFIPRDVSWLSFNARVLQEANDPKVPLKERVRFLGIYSNNRDEFFRVRVAALKKMMESRKGAKFLYLGDTPKNILNKVQRIVLQQQKDFNRIWRNVLNDLKKERVFLVNEKRLNAAHRRFILSYFEDEVRSSIIPLFIENIPELPSLWDKSIFLGVVMFRKESPSETKYAIIEIPTKSHSRFVILPSAIGEQRIMLLEDVIRFNLPHIFAHLGVFDFQAHMFKVTKDAEIDIDNDISTSMVEKIEKGIKNRRKAKAVRLLYDKDMNDGLLRYLVHKLNLSHKDSDSVIPSGSIRNFRDFMDFPAILPNRAPRSAPFIHPALADSLRVSDVVLKQDVLLHFPYHSFNSIIDLLREAAMDPDVESIRITSYRLAPNSKICNALINAVRNGRRVEVFLELRARFDEEANLDWKTKLEEEGVKVYAGTFNMKVHAKICVIKKRIDDRIVQYGFIGTGNLNEVNAPVYTDHFLLTSNRAIIADLNRVFRALENPEVNMKQLQSCKTLLVCPVNGRKALLNMMQREIKAAKAGRQAKISIIVNSLSDEKLIRKLYQALDAGVEIRMVIRSICCAEVDQNKHHNFFASSIVDEYLEHGRIWIFNNNGKEDTYISSADWMTRNLDYRIEVSVPIKNKTLKKEIKEIMDIKFRDNVKARILDCSGSNQYVASDRGKRVRSQIEIYRYLENKR